MCAHRGGHRERLAGVVKEHYSKKLLTGVVLLVVIANTINIGADIGAIASASQLVFNLPFALYAIVSAVVIVLLEIFINYKSYAKFLKFLTSSLLAYPVTALIVHEPWRQILAATVDSAYGIFIPISLYRCWCVWDDDYAVSIFLAGIGRS